MPESEPPQSHPSSPGRPTLDYASAPYRSVRWYSGNAEWAQWGLFLGASWTWCIGMFLPVLLIRDYGRVGWYVFAIPNVLGAAAMGWVIRSRAHSAEIIRAHQSAGLSFSVVTIAFHVFFAGWLIRSWWGDGAMLVLLVLAVLAFGVIRLFRGAERIIAFAALFLSAAWCLGLAEHERGWLWPAVRDGRELAALAPICLFGFALCPYLDLTFHRARMRLVSPADARAGFAFGFGVPFLLMICLTPLYAMPMWYLLKDGYFALSEQVTSAVAKHLLLQSGVTVAFHASEVVERRRATPIAVWFGIAIVLLASALVGSSIDNLNQWHGLNSGEVIYRVFMGFYGLIFPAYVWLCMIPGRGRVAPDRWQWGVLAGAVIVAAPMFWMGFIERKMGWLLPGLAVVLAARLLIPRKRAGSPPYSNGADL